MKIRIAVIGLMVLLVTVITGCGGAHRYDGRLVAVDSLLQVNPDSALALVEAISPDSLVNDGDRTYRDLLLTQARYKCYITATSDSDINRALDYYCRHSGDREKLTRAYIFKGAVMDELGHPDSAMYYYKTAEATAAHDDYANLGYANLRIAQLYQSRFVNDSAVVARMRIANKCFSLTNDTNYLITTSGTLGAFGTLIGKDSARFYLKRAINLAKTVNYSDGIQYQSKLAGSYFYDGEYRRAKEVAMEIYWNDRNKCNESQFYYYAARSYIRLNCIDSARWLIKQIPSPNNVVDSLNHYLTLAELAHASRQYDDYVRYEEKAQSIETRIMEDSRNDKLTENEFKWDANWHENEIKSHAKYRIIKIVGIILFIIIVLATAFFLIIQNHIRKHHRELEIIRGDLEQLLSDLEKERVSFDTERQDFISQIEEKDIELAEVNMKKQQLEKRQDSINKQASRIIKCRLAALNELYMGIKIEATSDDEKNRPLPLMYALKDLFEKKRIKKMPLSKSFWENIRLSVEGEYPGIVTFVEKNHPNLSKRDMQLFLLLCARLPNQIINICMNYTSDATASKRKANLLKNKMGLDMKIDQFIDLYIKGELGNL